MTDNEKLQELFAAALKAPEIPTGLPLRRAVSVSVSEPAAARQPATPGSVVRDPIPESEAAAAAAAEAGEPAKGNLLDDAASAELGALLDEQMRRKTRKQRRGAVVTAVVFLGLAGGGFAWFVQSPARVEAFTSAIHEIRSANDVKSIVAKYQAGLDRIAVRSKQIDQATTAVGGKVGSGDDEDPNFNAEMKGMMGGEGKTVGDRNNGLRKSFGATNAKGGGLSGGGLSQTKTP